MNSLQKRAIAKLAYNDVLKAIEKWHNIPDLPIHVVWAGGIEVDGELFHAYQLKEYEEVE